MNNNQENIISKVVNIVKNTFLKESSGHDWWHIYRVWQNSINISKNENADMFIVQLAALLHDIADWKFHNGDQNAGPEKAGEILDELDVDKKTINFVKDIIKRLSFKGAKSKAEKMNTIEGLVVQDADRLDAMGAIGIARTFAYGGYDNRVLYDPEIKPVMHNSPEEYIKNTSPTVNHFYEKLFLLKDLMNTDSAKKIAEKRHEFMKVYLDQFYKEWNHEF